MYKRIIVKIGSNVLARTDGTLDSTRLSSIVDQIATIRKQGIEVIMVSSGAVTCGRTQMPSVDLRALDSVARRQLFSAVGQTKLMNKYYDLFREYNITIGQVLTMKESFSTRHHYLNQRNCMDVMLAHGVLPIVNENDTISVTELMFTDNDELSGLVATMMDADALVILSNVDGIYTGRPGAPGAELIPIIVPGEDLGEYIDSTKSDFGRGGMLTKCKIARKVASEGVDVYIANGKRDNILCDLIIGHNDVPCTRFESSNRGMSTVKRWLAHSDGFAKGVITVNERAAAIISGDKAVSLLPVGVVAVEGDFERDDIVRIVDPNGHSLGLGRVSTDADTARSQIGSHGCRPLIHYDYLFLE